MDKIIVKYDKNFRMKIENIISGLFTILISKENFTQWIMDFHLMRQLGYIILILKGI